MVNADPRQRLRDLSSERGVSLAQLSGVIGRNTTYLQQFVRKGSPRKLEETDRRTLARYLGVDEAELGAPEEKSSETPAVGDWIEIPRLPLGAAAGAGTYAGDERPIGAFGFSARWLREQGLDPGMLSTIVVEGDSMEPVLRDGDEILVDGTPRPPREGVHVVRVDGALLVKKLGLGQPGVIRLISENKLYDPVELPAGDVAVIGRVVWKGGKL